jgi:hypothetical protein
MLEGLFFLFLFVLSILTYPFRCYHKHKRKEKQQQEKPIIYLPSHLSRIDKTLETLEYGRYGESTAELDLEDEEY